MDETVKKKEWYICALCDRREYTIDAPVCDCQPEKPLKMRLAREMPYGLPDSALPRSSGKGS